MSARPCQPGTGLPTTAANIQNSQVANAATPIQLQQGLLGQLQNFAGLQGGQNQTTLGQGLSSLSPPAFGPALSRARTDGCEQELLPAAAQQSLSGVSPNLSGQ